ncbi:glycosyltransferase family 2 protein [Winogradskyella litoriviva]|uniref:Glycosyltransferase family 2 protein n=1 Tax=Winogradskyella litoriviva TaxID=1220182 RepID=A0ABX2E3A3_9FLAO|nr:glycosyltransferase family 2 protein [Winogradskyella litoriviva]NRD22830.1 glycosyltransferase family 2 protein [Winogradskyella litoriviva]
MSLQSGLLISIIIPTYNRADILIETIDSVIEQTYKNWECIIVDDGSTDNTEFLVNEYIQNNDKFRFYKRPSSSLKGANACRNYGLQKSNGALVNWVDSDDKLTKNHLEVHVNLHLNTTLEASVSNSKIFYDSSINLDKYWSNIYPKEDLVTEMMANKTLWPIGGVVWSKSALPKSPFDETLASSQEWTFHLKILVNKLSYQLIDDVTYLARGHNDRIGKNVSRSKTDSTAASRFQIFDVYYNAKQLNSKRESILLQTVSTTLMEALKLKYYDSVNNIIKGLCHRFFKSNYKLKLIRVIFVAPVIYTISGKGYKLFKI